MLIVFPGFCSWNEASAILSYFRHPNYAHKHETTRLWLYTYQQKSYKTHLNCDYYTYLQVKSINCDLFIGSSVGSLSEQSLILIILCGWQFISYNKFDKMILERLWHYVYTHTHTGTHVQHTHIYTYTYCLHIQIWNSILVLTMLIHVTLRNAG